MSAYPALSLVISTWRRKVYLEKILFILTQQNFSRTFEVIICDSDSRDGTKELILKYKRNPKIIFRYYNLKNNISIKRNFGLRNAKSRNVVFLDDDCLPEKNFVKKYYKLLKDANSKRIYCGFVKFPQKQLVHNYFKYRQSRHFLKLDNQELNENTIVTMNMGMNKNLISKKNIFFDKNLGFLGKNLNGFEDYEFGFRLRKNEVKILKCDCVIYHLDKRNLKQHAKKYFIFGKYAIHKLKKVNYKACKNNFLYKLKNFIIIKLILKNSFMVNFMMSLSNYLINRDYKNKDMKFIYYKFVLFSNYMYGVYLEKNAK